MLDFVSIDFEGTHKDPRRGYPHEMGVAVFRGGLLIESRSWDIALPVNAAGKIFREVDAVALSVSGKSYDRLIETGQDSLFVLSELEYFLQRNDAVGLPNLAFNHGYDMECYRQMLFECSSWHPSLVGKRINHCEILGSAWFDLMVYYRMRFPVASHDFNSCLSRCGLSRLKSVHAAEEDAILNGRCYLELLLHG